MNNRFKRYLFPMCLALLITSACTTSTPWPSRVRDMPPCYAGGGPGVWVCDVRAEKTCLCYSQAKFQEWRRRNGI